MPRFGCGGARIPRAERTGHLFVQAEHSVKQDSASAFRDLEDRSVTGPSALRTVAKQKDEEFATL